MFLVFLYTNSVRICVRKIHKKEVLLSQILTYLIIRNSYVFYFMFKTH